VKYDDYLQLKPLLACQQPLTAEHDERLLVIIHQTTELWRKLTIHELRAVVAPGIAATFRQRSRCSRASDAFSHI
jgi:tryptophan 2,3-dioxygenase